MTRERGERGRTLVLWLTNLGSGGRMWVLIWAALLFSLAERATFQSSVPLIISRCIDEVVVMVWQLKPILI